MPSPSATTPTSYAQQVPAVRPYAYAEHLPQSVELSFVNFCALEQPFSVISDKPVDANLYMRNTSGTPNIVSTRENSDLLLTAYALRDEGKYKEALDIFVSIADKQENLFEKAGMLLNIVNATEHGQVELAKTQLDSVRSLVSSL